MIRTGTTALNGALTQTAPSTPIRAITSTLSARSAPSIPPASQIYQPLVKAVLRHRLLYNTILPSIALSWAVTVVRSISLQGGMPHVGVWGTLQNCVSPLTLLFALATWVFGTLPVIVLRHRYIAAAPTTAPSPSKMFRTALSKRSTPHALVTYTASAITVALLYVVMTFVYDTTASGSRFSLFVKSKKHPYYLNGHTLYLFSSQLALACAYLLRGILLDRLALRWPRSSPAEPELQAFVLARLATVLVTIALFNALSIAAHTVLFGFARSVVLPLLYALPFVSRALRPFSAHFLRGSWSLYLVIRHWSMVCRAFYLGFATLMSWEFAEHAYGESIAVAQSTADPSLTLVSGVTSADTYFKHLAYSELLQLASDDTQVAHTRISALFADQKFNPSMWACLVRESLLTLGKDYQLLLRRGKPEAPAPAAPVQPKANPPLPAPATPLIRAPILKAAPSSPLRAALDTFASDGPLSTAVASSADAGATHIPELFRSVLPAHPPAQSAVETAKKSDERVLGALERAWRGSVGSAVRAYAPEAAVAVGAQMREWWTRERVHRLAEACLPNRHLDALVASVLCRLTCASLADDQYGVVQRDIPRILEALLAFLTAVEEYQAEINAAHPPPSPEEVERMSAKEIAGRERLAVELAQAGDVLSEVGDALKDGVGQIALAFGDKLGAFRFPPRIATKLQGFVDYL
ncbi:nucleoporin protein Ndc1-Nup [Amylocystis lapponica]|nr:nucleoporin protein Ndc1-Nup [Amylocystis lapponica]